MNKIFTFGDGFATGHIWPEWPQIMDALLEDYEIINISGVGAGPEFLVTSLVNNIDKLRGQTVVFQWPFAFRFDKLLEDDTWDKIISSDTTYCENIKTINDQRWWLSSASLTDEIAEYSKFIQEKQAQTRLEVYKVLTKHTLDNLLCNYYFTSTIDEILFSKQSRFHLTKLQEIQPSPVVHYYFVVEEIIPSLGIELSINKKKTLENLILETKWVPYDPNRDEIWNEIVNKIDKY